jgi:hypothetical protein
MVRLSFAPIEARLMRRYSRHEFSHVNHRGQTVVTPAVDPVTGQFTLMALGRLLAGADPSRSGPVRHHIVKRWRTKGVTVWEADCIAVRCGDIASAIWPEWAETIDAEIESTLWFDGEEDPNNNGDHADRLVSI